MVSQRSHRERADARSVKAADLLCAVEQEVGDDQDGGQNLDGLANVEAEDVELAREAEADRPRRREGDFLPPQLGVRVGGDRSCRAVGALLKSNALGVRAVDVRAHSRGCAGGGLLSGLALAPPRGVDRSNHALVIKA